MHEGHQRGQPALILRLICSVEIIIFLPFAKRSEDPFGLHAHQSLMILYLNHAGFISLTYLCSGLRFNITDVQVYISYVFDVMFSAMV